MRKSIYIIVLILCSLLWLTGCRNDIVYSHFTPIEEVEGSMVMKGWHMDSIIPFSFHIDDISPEYTILVYVRHSERYPYQNMWLFVKNDVKTDTIEFYLADDRGQWLGNRHSGFIEMPILLEEHKHFPDTGLYHLSIQQGMRDTLLMGITDVGVEVIEN